MGAFVLDEFIGGGRVKENSRVVATAAALRGVVRVEGVHGVLRIH